MTAMLTTRPMVQGVTWYARENILVADVRNAGVVSGIAQRAEAYGFLKNGCFVARTEAEYGLLFVLLPHLLTAYNQLAARCKLSAQDAADLMRSDPTVERKYKMLIGELSVNDLLQQLSILLSDVHSERQEGEVHYGIPYIPDLLNLR